MSYHNPWWSVNGSAVCIVDAGVYPPHGPSVCFSDPAVLDVAKLPMDDIQGTDIGGFCPNNLFEDESILLPQTMIVPKYPIGAEVKCMKDEAEEQKAPGVVIDSIGDEVDVVFLDGSDEMIILPAEWCEPNLPEDLWTMGPFLYTPGYLHQNEFHLAISLLARDFPDAPPSFFSYWQEIELVPTNESEEEDIMDVLVVGVPGWIKLYLDQQTPWLTDRVFQKVPRRLSFGVDEKFLLYTKYNGTAAADAFPETFSTIAEALDATHGDTDADPLFFLKDSRGTRGSGIRVLRRSELTDEPEPKYGTVVIQRAVDDLLVLGNASDGASGLLDGCRFDIRFFVVIHNGRAYIHSHMYGMWNLGGKPYDPEDSAVANNVPKLSFYDETLQNDREKGGFWFPDAGPNWKLKSPTAKVTLAPGRFDPMSWRDAIATAMDTSMPVFEDLLNATASDPTRYAFFGCDAIIQRSGKAVILEMNDFPDMRFSGGRKKFLLSTRTSYHRMVLLDPSEKVGYVLTPRTPLYTHLAIERTSQKLRDMMALVMGLEKPENLDRLREIGKQRH